MMENKSCLLFIVLLIATIAEAAEDFDGSRKMICQPLQGHDCLPTTNSCKILTPESDPGRDLRLAIDVVNKTVKSPYRTELLTIKNVANNAESLVLQGTNVGTVWSATVHRTTGRLTIAIVDRKGAYVVFGQCKLAPGS